MWIWHKEAKSKKFEVEVPRVPERHYYSRDTIRTAYPVSEYESCPAPEPEKRWRDITDQVVVNHEG